VKSLTVPDYLKVPEHSSAKIWGKLEKYNKTWIVDGHPYMISLAKRLFPGSKGNGHGSASFPASKRIIGDLSWFMQRFPLDIKDKKSWIKDLAEAQSHFKVQESMLKKPKKSLPAPKFKGELKEFQKEGLAFLLHNPRSLLADQMGLGKANWIESFVFTPCGKEKIKDIKVGDSVIGSDGKATIINGVYPQGIRKLYKITFNDGSSTLVDKEHLWSVNNRNHHRGEPTIMLTTEEMLDEEGVKLHKGNGHNKNKTYQFKTYYKEQNGNNKWQIPMVKQIEFEEQNIPPIEPYLLGLILGDGCIRDNRVDFFCHKNDFEEILKGQTYKETKTRTRENVRRASFLQHRNDIKRLGLADSLSYNKFIPKSYKYSSPEDRLSLLQGLMDTDGCPLSDGHGTEYCTVSKQLALDVKELVETLGGIARLKIKKKPKYTYKGIKKIGKKAYRLNIKLPEGFNPFRLKRKAEKYKIPSKYKVNRYIKDIKYEKKGEAVCIKVAAEDGLFVVDHCIVTHNTPTAISWLTSLKCSPPYIVVAPPHLLRQWKSEIGKFLGEETSVHIITGLKPYSLPASEIYLIHYLLLRGWKNYLPNFGFNACVFDEIQDLRRSGSDKYSAASLLAESTDSVIGLSGTPVYNLGAEIWNVLNILEYNCLGDFGNFTREWCEGYGSYRIADPKLLGEYLKEEGLILRRRKEDVLSELPPKRRIIQNIDVDEGKYDELIAPIIDQAKRITDIKDAFERGRETMMAIDSTRMITGIAKAHYVCAFVKTLMEAGETVILYGHHHKVMDIYMEELKDSLPVMISGRQTPTIKDEAQKAFMDGDTDLIIISLRSATGLNLQRAKCVVFGELDWSPAVHCLDEQTEILTKDGFRDVNNISIGDIVAGFDIRDGVISFVPALDKVDRLAEKNETIYRINTKKIDLAVTGNHRMVYHTLMRTNKGNKKSEWKIDTAAKIAGTKRRYIPTCGIEDAKGVPLSDDELKLIGLFLSDGHFTGKELIIYQSVKQPWNKEIVKILNGAGMSWTLFVQKKGKYSDLNWYIIPAGIQPRWTKNEVETLIDLKNKGVSNREISKKINRTEESINQKIRKMNKGIFTQPGNEKPRKGWKSIESYLDKNLSPLLQNLTQHQLDCLIYGIWLGDGSKTNYSVKRICNINKILLERLQSLCIRRERTAILIERKSRTSSGNPAYDLYISKNKDAYLQDGKTHKSRFKMDKHPATGERVWCVTNRLGTIIVRRNGKVAIVGNSQSEDRCHRMGTKDSVLCYYLTCHSGTDQAMLETLGLKTSQFVSIMGDREETEQDKLMAQVDTKKHMKQVIELLQKGGKKKEISDKSTIEKLRKLERMPPSKEPTSISEFYDMQD